MPALALHASRRCPPAPSSTDTQHAHRARPGAHPTPVTEAIDALRRARVSAGHPLDAAESDALAVIYRAYAGTLRTVARRYVGADEAEDVVHDVFYRLPVSIAQYRDGGFGGWLKQCTTRVALMRLRSARRQQAVTVDDACWHHGARAHDADRLAAHGELQWALAQLPVHLRQVVTLRVCRGHTHQEIAAQLGITPTASEVRLCRALKRLRAVLGPEREPAEGFRVSRAS
jgi:RNA polymerase sigma-70 factor, ECF subfamily